MLSKCRRPPISTVHFKRQLSLPPSLSQTSQNFPPHQSNPPSSPPSLLGDSAHSFCSNALKISAKMGLHSGGKQVHARVIKLGLHNVLSLQNQILYFYVKCKNFCDADRLFDEMRERNVVTWNTMICGVIDCGSNCRSSIFLVYSYFRRMLLNNVGLDHITIGGLVRACAQLNDTVTGRQMHCFLVKFGFYLDCFVGSTLVDMYGKCGLIEEARRVFDEVLYRDLVLWNVMVSSYAFNFLAKYAFEVFNLMKFEGFKGDDFTFCSLLNACGTSELYEQGRQIHGLIIKMSFDVDVVVASALVDMYAKNKIIDDARKAFDSMAARNVVTWNTMVVGYGQNGNGREALRLFREMLLQNYCPDDLTMASILSSCSNLSSINEIVQVHAHVVKNGFQCFLSITNALINAYSGSGHIDSAVQCFLSVREPDIVTYTSIISAYAVHGLSKESIKIFEKMLSSSVRPDRIAFLVILAACSHEGLVSEGLHYFNVMTDEYQIVPDSEHYTCLIDLLGRAGLIDEASNVLTSMPIAPTSDSLGALLGACSIHGYTGIIKWASEKLFALEPREPVSYTLISNIYASKGLWSDVASVRKMMRDDCDYKVPGCSWMDGVCR